MQSLTNTEKELMDLALVELNNISFVYGVGAMSVKALDGVTLTIEKENITGLIGPTGSGKSTLVQLLNGILKPTDGTVRINGRNIWENPKKIRDVRFEVGLVMQYPEYQLFDETVASDIAFGPKNMGLDDAEVKRRVAEATEFVNLAPSLLTKSPFDLSGGQKRRAALAGVIAMKPGLLVLDEPAAGLDPGGRREILGRIREFHEKSGTAVIIVSHSMEDMAMYCERIVVMKSGKVLTEDTTAEVFSRYDELVASGLNVPEITRMVNEMKSLGIDIGGGVFTVDDALERILSYRSAGKAVMK